MQTQDNSANSNTPRDGPLLEPSGGGTDGGNDGNDGGAVNAKTPKYLVVTIANRMVNHLKTLTVIQQREDLMVAVNNLRDFEFLYRLALIEFQSQEGMGLQNMRTFTRQILTSFGLNEKDIPPKSLTFLQSCVQAIAAVFKEKVFNK